MRSTRRKLTVISAKVPHEERAKLDAIAQVEGTSRSALVRQMLAASVHERLTKMRGERENGA